MSVSLLQRLKEYRTRLRHWFFAVMQRKLPRRSKRIIFTAAIAGQLERTDTLSHETLTKLNEVLRLTSQEDALKLPVYLNKVIWRGCSLDVLTYFEEDTAEMLNWVKGTVPDWLRYGRASDMISDALAVKRLVDGNWSEESVVLAKRQLRSFLPGFSSSHELNVV